MLITMKKTLVISVCVFVFLSAFVQAASRNYNKFTPNEYRQLYDKRNKFSPVQFTNWHTGIVQVVVDYSGSMKDWIEDVKTTVLTIMSNTSSKTKIGLRIFGQLKDFPTALDHCEMTLSLSCPKQNNTASISSMIKKLNSSKLGMETPLVYALEQTVNKDLASFPSPYVKKKIVLITDGVDTCGGDACAFVKELMAKRNDIVIDVIMIDSSDNLSCIADETNGTYYNVKTKDEFVKSLKNIFDNLYKMQQAPKKQIHYQFIPITDNVLN